jgi:hypothetical protein
LLVVERQPGNIAYCFHQVHWTARLPHGAFHFRMSGMPYQDHGLALTAIARHLRVHLGNQRAGGIEDFESARPGLSLHLPGNPMGAEITVAPDGTAANSSTNTAPLDFKSSTTKRLCTTSWRTKIGAPKASSARSTISIARSTPAQKPLGLASRSSSASGSAIIRLLLSPRRVGSQDLDLITKIAATQRVIKIHGPIVVCYQQ